MNLKRIIKLSGGAIATAMLIFVGGCSIIIPTTSAPKSASVQPIGKPIPTALAGQQNTPAPTAVATAPVISTTKPITALKSVNWKQTLTTDPQLSFDKKATDDALKVSKVDQGPFIRAKATFGGAEVAGHAGILKDSIMYADISDDGQAEAIIMLSPGGSAGNVGALIFSPDTANKPVLVAVLDGNKLSVSVEDGELVVTRPIVAGFEPNCCPSGFNTKHYKLVAGAADFALKELKSSNEGAPEAQVMVVEQFYKLLNSKKLKEAYDMLALSLQTQQEFDAWQTGYADLKEIRISTKLLPSNLVFVDINGKVGNTAQKFNGTWKLGWDDKTTRWQLTENNIKTIASTTKDVQAPKVASQKISPNIVYYGNNCGTKPTQATLAIKFSDPSGVAEARIEYVFLKDKIAIGVAKAKDMIAAGKDNYTFSIDVGASASMTLKTGAGTLKTVVVATDMAGNQGVIDLPAVQVQQCK